MVAKQIVLQILFVVYGVDDLLQASGLARWVFQWADNEAIA